MGILAKPIHTPLDLVWNVFMGFIETEKCVCVSVG